MRIIEHKVYFELAHNLTLVINVAYDLTCMPRMTRVEIVEDAVRQAHDNGITVNKDNDLIRIEAVK